MLAGEGCQAALGGSSGLDRRSLCNCIMPAHITRLLCSADAAQVWTAPVVTMLWSSSRVVPCGVQQSTWARLHKLLEHEGPLQGDLQLGPLEDVGHHLQTAAAMTLGDQLCCSDR